MDEFFAALADFSAENQDDIVGLCTTFIALLNENTDPPLDIEGWTVIQNSVNYGAQIFTHLIEEEKNKLREGGLA